MKSLKGIASFVAVASSGSFAAAAKLQGVSAVAVSKNVATLERQLGVRLFQRTTRKLSLTSEGQTFYRQCQGPLRELEAAQAVVEHSSKALSGQVRVTCVAPFAMGYIVPLIPRFHAINPKVQIELHLDDTVSDMVEQGYDVGIRVGLLKDSSLVARPIAPLPFVVCASNDYLKQHGQPTTLEQLAQHNCLRLCWPGSRDPVPWFLRGWDMQEEKTMNCNLIVNDFSALAAAAVLGHGLICIPLQMAMPLFRAGQLRPVLTDYMEAKLKVYLYYPHRKNLPVRTRSFIDFVLNSLAGEEDLHMPHQALVAPFVKSLV